MCYVKYDIILIFIAWFVIASEYVNYVQHTSLFTKHV